MGKPTVMQEVRQLYCIYKIQLRERKAPVYQRISGTGQRRWRMIKEAERYLDYAWLIGSIGNELKVMEKRTKNIFE